MRPRDEPVNDLDCPKVSTARAALRAATLSPSDSGPGPSGGWSSLGVLPGAGAALLPIGLCPACWPAYAAVLASLGLGFLLEARFLLPLTVALLGLALLALGVGARKRRGPLPLALGSVSAAAILAFKFALPSAPLVYAGLLGLVAASAWNAWPRPRALAAACPRCVPEGHAGGNPNEPFKGDRP